MALESDILIIGGGFAGFSLFRQIDRRKRQVRLLTDRNHFLFTPLLPLAAVGSVEVRSIVESVHLFEKKKGEVIIGKAVDLLPAEKKVVVEYSEGRKEEISYKELVIASGSITATFNIPGVYEHTYFVKEMRDARRLREKILYQFDRANSLQGEERKAALTFAVVGAGATGVETACEIDDLVQEDLVKYYPELARGSRIVIIEAAKEILTVFDRTLAAYASLKMKQKGIEVRTETPVKAIEKNKLVLGTGDTLAAETIIWATGNGPSAFILKAAERMQIKLARGGRISVKETLLVDGPVESIFTIGDCSAALDQKGQVLPATAQVAMKQGVYLGKYFSGKKQKPFYFKSMGMLASLGSKTAIADLGGNVRFKGMLAWWFWKAAYLTRLVSMRNRVSVAFDWMKVRMFGRNTARIDYD